MKLAEKKKEKKGPAATVETAPFEPMYSFEVASNRYDLLSVEGLAKTLSVFLGLSKMPTYTAAKLNKPREQLIVKSSVNLICSLKFYFYFFILFLISYINL